MNLLPSVSHRLATADGHHINYGFEAGALRLLEGTFRFLEYWEMLSQKLLGIKISQIVSVRASSRLADGVSQGLPH